MDAIPLELDVKRPVIDPLGDDPIPLETAAAQV